MIGYGLGTARQPLPLDEHLFAVVQARQLRALRSPYGSRPCSTTSANRTPTGRARSMRRPGADRHPYPGRLRYPSRLQHEVCQLVAGHAFSLDGPLDALFARRFLAAHGSSCRASSSSTSAPTSPRRWSRRGSSSARAAPGRPRGGARSPHRLADLAVDGDDLLAIGYTEGPALGAALARLLDVVVDEPGRERRGRLLERARAGPLTAAEVRDALRAPARAGGRRSDGRRRDEVRVPRGARRARGGGRRGGRREPRAGPRPRSTPPTATRSGGTSSATSSRTRSSSSTRSASSSTRSTPTRRRAGSTVPALLEVNLSGEATKSGVAPDEVGDWLARYPTSAG